MSIKPLRTIKQIQKKHAALFGCDLAHRPLRYAGLPKEIITQRGLPKRRYLSPFSVEKTLTDDISGGISILAKWIHWEENAPSGFFFSTRPFGLSELYLVAVDPFDPKTKTELNAVLFALRGFTVTEELPKWDNGVLCVPRAAAKPRYTIAVSSWMTKEVSFVAAVMGETDPTEFSRYQRLNRFINELISKPSGADYLVLPEVALPPKWFMRLADKLKGRGISLISGIEYLHGPGKTVRNQVWASLIHTGFGFPSMLVYKQDKQRPAFPEEKELHRLAGVTMQPAIKFDSPPVVQHGGLRFAMLVCSELTNIHNRSNLRGKIDALFVPEWNTDVDTFAPLVESAALDIHAYIIQCNNRDYGDSRIRAPYKERWKRDVLRVKGGIHDYCVVGEIDVLALRQFQSSHRSPTKGYKPVPDGFNDDMSEDRKVLPKGDS